MNERELVQRAVEGDSEALAQLVQQLQPTFLRLARRMMLDPTDAEDATQEALLRVVTRLSQFQGAAKLSTWATRLAVNTFIDFRSQRYRAAALTLPQFESDLADGLEPEAPERADDGALLEQLKRGCGTALLATLDADHRAAYVLGEILELSGAEAAEVLEVDAATFRKRLSRARERVREALGQVCGVFDEANACRCHRRLTRATQLGRVRDEGSVGQLDLAALRRQLGAIDALERAAVFYRADLEPPPRRDFVRVVRELLEVTPNAHRTS